ncbi:Cytochrome P450 4c3 [Blattella germanica]|nr:Cytochrome P450 4c3 [Blattella germanica]
MTGELLRSYLLYLLVLTGGMYILIFLFKRQRKAYPCKEMPGPLTLPLVGNSYMLLGCSLSEAFNRVRRIRKQYGNTVKFSIGKQLLVTISEPVAIERTIGNKSLIERSELAKLITKELFRNGLLLNGGETWRLHRKIISLMFHNSVLDKFVEIFSNNATIMTEKLSQIPPETIFNTYEYAVLCTIDAIYESILGKTVNAQLERRLEFPEHLSEVLKIIGERARRPWLFLDFFFRRSEFSDRMNREVNFFYDHAKQILNEQRDKYIKTGFTQEGSKTKSILDLFIENGDLEDEEILEETVTMLTTGSETTATVFSLALVALGHHQDVQEKVIEEQWSIFGQNCQRPVTKEDLHHMHYLEQVLKEVMRLFPPVTFIFRTVQEDTDLGNGYLAPKGSSITVLSNETHRDPAIYENPNEFDPDRFSPENCFGRHPYAYIPFGGGRRICVGYKYAMMEMKTMLSVMLRRLRVVRAIDDLEKIEKKLEFGLILRSSIGYKIHIESR